MDSPKIKLEQVLFACAVALGLILRFMNLGTAPLSDAEGAGRFRHSMLPEAAA